MNTYLLAEVPNYPMYIGAALLVTVIAAFIFKMIFANDKKIKLMETQNELLKEIASKVSSNNVPR